MNKISENQKNDITMAPKVKRLRWLTLISHVSLLVWISFWYLIFNNSDKYSTTFVVLLFILPLLLPLPGILKAKAYTHAWACFIVLWYFLHSITTLYAEPQLWLFASIELILAISMFIGCSMFARLRGKELGTNLPKLSVVMEQERKAFENQNTD